MDSKKIICCLLWSITFSFVQAQNFGAVPAGIKWNQLHAPTANIIFPKGYDSIAARIATITEEMVIHRRDSLGHVRKPFKIVLHPFSNVSNGFVMLAPFHSEFYLHQPFNALENGSLNWADQLAIHEYRHVQQYEGFNTGLSKWSGILFGENARALANAVAVPDWFFEGDAVYNETFYSSEGRGRLPSFFDGFRQLFKDSLKYKYALLRNGSYQKYVPNHYALGYLLTAYGYEKYGNAFWSKVSWDAASFQPLFYPFQGAIKKYTGISFPQFTKEAFTYFQKKWEAGKPTANVKWLTPIEKNNVVDYRFPFPDADGNIIVLKNSFTAVTAFYRLDKNLTEHFIAKTDISVENSFSYRSGKIVTGFDMPDIRYAHKDFTGIKILDIQTGEVNKIGKHSHYFTPDISPDTRNIIVVDMPNIATTELALLNEHGELIKQFQPDPSLYFSYPKFTADCAAVIVLVRNDNGDMGIQKIDLVSGKKEMLLPLHKRLLSNPVIQGDTLLCVCAHDDAQEIWAITENEAACFKTAINGYNAYQAMLSGDGNLVVSTFTANGFRLASVQPSWQPVDVSDTLLGLFVKKPFDQKENNFLKEIPKKNYPISPYKKFSHPFHIHSWNPVIDDPEFSFYLYGQNILNTVQSQLYYTYNSNERSHTAGFNGIYGGWFVQPFLHVSQAWDRHAVYHADTVFTWNETNTGVGFQLPLNFSQGRQYRYLTASVAYHFNTVKWTGIAKNLFKNEDLDYMQYRLEYIGTVQQARKQINPHWAQYFSFQYLATNGKAFARQWNLNGKLFLPGLASTHSLVLSTAMQHTDRLQQYFFSNNFQPARGYPAYRLPMNIQVGTTYHFPLCYPEWGFQQIVFLSRVRAAVFYDHGWGKNYVQQRLHFRSFGGEIYLDTKWWNQQAIAVGIRYSRLLDADHFNLRPNQWEIILPVKLFRQ